MRFEIGKVYEESIGTEHHIIYKVLDTDDDVMLIKMIFCKNGMWSAGEQDVFSMEMSIADGVTLNKEYTVKELLRNVEKQEKADSKRSAKGNAGDSKPKTKKGCKKCDSSGCRCNASGR